MKNNINSLIINSIYNNIKNNYKSLFNTYQFNKLKKFTDISIIF